MSLENEIAKLTQAVKELTDLLYTSPSAPEQPKAEQPKAEQPKAEQPKAEQPKAEQPKAEQPKAEQPKAEQPKAEQPKAEQPKAEHLKAEQPKAEQPKAEQPDNEDIPFISHEDLKNLCLLKSRENGENRPKIKAILAEFKAKKVLDLDAIVLEEVKIKIESL